MPEDSLPLPEESQGIHTLIKLFSPCLKIPATKISFLPELKMLKYLIWFKPCGEVMPVDNLEFGLRVAILGFSTVLITLFILYTILVLFARLFNRMPQGEEELPPIPGEITGERGITPVTAAAITAAIAHCLDLNDLHGKPLAVTVERAREASRNAWASAGRRVMMEGKLELERLRRKKNQ